MPSLESLEEIESDDDLFNNNEVENYMKTHPKQTPDGHCHGMTMSYTDVTRASMQT